MAGAQAAWAGGPGLAGGADVREFVAGADRAFLTELCKVHVSLVISLLFSLVYLVSLTGVCIRIVPEWTAVCKSLARGAR